MTFHSTILDLDPARETERIVSWLQENLRGLRKTGVVLGISGGIDSSVSLALCAKAFAPERIVAIMMPEKDSDVESEAIARRLAACFGVEPLLEVITPVLEGFGCYPRRDEAIARVFPEFNAAKGYKAKIVLAPSDLAADSLNIFHLVIITPGGEEKRQRLGPREYAQIVAASNFKQRTRMSMCYYHAELRNYAVIGTPNKNEHDQGFFVKHGDGGVDLKPIVHLYKTQIYQLAEYLGVPQEIIQRPPTSDTYSAPSTQEEFFFRLPFRTMDLLYYGYENQVSAAEVAPVLSMTEAQVEHAYQDFTRKRRTTAYLRTPPLDMAQSH
jgi:NAD+ synthase